VAYGVIIPNGDLLIIGKGTVVITTTGRMTTCKCLLIGAGFRHACLNVLYISNLFLESLF